MAAKTVSAAGALSLNDRRIAGLIALILGAFMIYGAGLAQSQTLHDTAHDTRHSYGFPCH